jgi:CRISPR-associated endonuclease/helicase Cas3
MGSGKAPYPYQRKFAINPWPDILKIETGMGKTASIIITWLYKRLLNKLQTPRRLVYCLPMRTLVEQTATNANVWIKRLVEGGILAENRRPSVHILMGGEIDKDWDRYPEKEAILIGTQDQLLSRALNRGYGMSRFRWPINFGLLHNDSLWVMDEVQLMGSGLATTAQLQAFRATLGTLHPVHSVWMSATLQKDWLRTIDFSGMTENLQEFTLTEEDRINPSVKKRLEARKPLERAEISTDKPLKIAELILDTHQRGTRTLVILNTVNRAAEIYSQLKRMKPEAALNLVHSRFRPGDRAKALEKILADPQDHGSICISTQVIEAGVDLSAATLVTDLAPWSSMVQRFGRCNRYGSDDNARVLWLDIDFNKKGAALPYTEEELKQAASVLQNLKDACPNNLPPVTSKPVLSQVIRRKDLVDLFDTTPDLAGFDIDISRYIRETNDHDVQVFWRDLKDEGPAEDEPAPSREELCTVPVNQLREADWLEEWCWDHLEKRWVRQFTIAPGMILMLPTRDGGYSSEIGWTGNREDKPEPIDRGLLLEEGIEDDRYAATGWQTLAEHNNAVVRELRDIVTGCDLPGGEWIEALLLAAHWHDTGKAHEVFQKAMIGNSVEKDTSQVWAKTSLPRVVYERKGFRHELASALAAIQNGLPDLVAYLIAAHHGKVRLSIRSLPNEMKPDDPNKRFARGIWEGDILGEIDLGDGQKLPQTVLDLSYMDLGEGLWGPSWVARMLLLRDNPSLGPFRLAYLEALIRAADWRASQKAGKRNV